MKPLTLNTTGMSRDAVCMHGASPHWRRPSDCPWTQGWFQRPAVRKKLIKINFSLMQYLQEWPYDGTVNRTDQ